MEEYKDIPEFPGYKISASGNVINKHGMILAAHVASGYRAIKLNHVSGSRRSCLIHRLVYLAWSGPIHAKYWINHEDGNKLNNHISNLSVTTPSHNHIHARDVLKRKYASGDAIHISKLNEEAREAILFLLSSGWSQGKISRAFLVSQPSIHLLRKNHLANRAPRS